MTYMVNNMQDDDNETLDRLVKMITETNLVALDKTLFAIRTSDKTKGYAPAAVRVGSIAERIVRAAREVGMTLPEDKRAK